MRHLLAAPRTRARLASSHTELTLVHRSPVWPLASVLASVLASAVALAASPRVPLAQPLAFEDTTGVVLAVAAVLRPTGADRVSAPTDPPRLPWYVAPRDPLTPRLAAALGRATRPVPERAVCDFDAPAGAVVAFTTTVALHVVSADTVTVSLSNACRRTRRSAVGTHFVRADHYRVVRRGGVWVAKLEDSSIS